MKHGILLLIVAVISNFAFAENYKIKEIETKLKKEIRTSTQTIVITEGAENCFGSPGIYTQVSLEIKKASRYDSSVNSITYDWEKVRSIFLDIDGNVLELCSQ